MTNLKVCPPITNPTLHLLPEHLTKPKTVNQVFGATEVQKQQYQTKRNHMDVCLEMVNMVMVLFQVHLTDQTLIQTPGLIKTPKLRDQGNMTHLTICPIITIRLYPVLNPVPRIKDYESDLWSYKPMKKGIRTS